MNHHPDEQPSQRADFQLFADADPTSLETCSNTASNNTAMTSPGSLAATLRDATRAQLMDKILDLHEQLQVSLRDRAIVESALSTLESDYGKLKEENNKLATNLAEAQQRCDDNKPRRFEYGEYHK